MLTGCDEITSGFDVGGARGGSLVDSAISCAGEGICERADGHKRPVMYISRLVRYTMMSVIGMCKFVLPIITQ